MPLTPKEYSKCIGNKVIQSKEAQSSQDDNGSSNYPGYISIPDGAVGANAVLVQAYVNPDELKEAGLTFDDIAGIPLVTINESDYNVATLDSNNNLCINGVQVGSYSTPGQKLLNYGSYLIETGNNIRNAMIIPFNKDINVYVALTYFK